MLKRKVPLGHGWTWIPNSYMEKVGSADPLRLRNLWATSLALLIKKYKSSKSKPPILMRAFAKFYFNKSGACQLITYKAQKQNKILIESRNFRKHQDCDQFIVTINWVYLSNILI